MVGFPSQENNHDTNESQSELILHIRNTPLKAHLRTLTLPTVENIPQSNQSPSGAVYTNKKKIGGDLQDRFEHENT